DYRPFGEATLTKDNVTFNLRFPGQYYDSETGLHYNYFRDYDPTIGRYIQSDPIGLDGGLNPYLYANANPLRYTDPTGQFVFLLAPALAPALAALGDAALIAGGVLAAGALAENIMESRSRGKSDPVSGLQPVNPGRDCDGKCKPCPPPEIWEASGNAHGSTGGSHYHGIVWDQNQDTCECFPKRVSGSAPGDLR
ncbi:MAG: RHS repeat-associated core domain-containing protein, partial [Gammaproteobacteria bacterium]